MSEFDKWADEKERWDGEHSEARPLARLAWDFQQARNEALEAERRWIPVSERMPPYGEIVLTSTGGKYPAIDYLKPNNLFTADHVCEPQFNVKYWMPCPEPPELEGE